LRELDANYRMSKRELRRARKTAKTYEVMVALGKLPAQQQGTGTQAAHTTSHPEQETKKAPEVTATAQQQPAQAAAVATAMVGQCSC
jgi:zinc finger protein DZIP1